MAPVGVVNLPPHSAKEEIRSADERLYTMQGFAMQQGLIGEQTMGPLSHSSQVHY